MFSILLAIVNCPLCGEPLPVGDLAFPDEPMLTMVTCENCGGRVEVRKNEATGEIVAQVARPA